MGETVPGSKGACEGSVRFCTESARNSAGHQGVLDNRSPLYHSYKYQRPLGLEGAPVELRHPDPGGGSQTSPVPSGSRWGSHRARAGGGDWGVFQNPRGLMRARRCSQHLGASRRTCGTEKVQQEDPGGAGRDTDRQGWGRSGTKINVRNKAGGGPGTEGSGECVCDSLGTHEGTEALGGRVEPLQAGPQLAQ